MEHRSTYVVSRLPWSERKYCNSWLIKAPSRAALFRERAAQLRAMAEDEPLKQVRDKLLDLADQYEGLAARVGR